MPCYAFEGMVPVVDPTAYVHPLASLIGDVIVGPGCYIAPHASLRGDFGRIEVEGHVSVQDSCTLHGSSERDCVIGFGSTIGHGAVVHGARIGRHVLIGMNAVVLDDAVIGDECLVAAMSLVKGGAVVPARTLMAGNPARALRALAEGEIGWRNGDDGEYRRLASRSLAALVECPPLAAPEADRKRNIGHSRPVRLGMK